MKKYLYSLSLLTLTTCSPSHSPQPTLPPTLPITIPDPLSYLAQSQNPDGNALTPLRNSDPITYRRFDFGHVQASESFLTSPTSAITTWSYSPWKSYSPNLGDGGESYELQSNNTVKITFTKHLGIKTTALLPPWTVLTTDTISCSDGWTNYNLLSRGCKTFVTYPFLGSIDTVISEHKHPIEPTMERIFLARGWGRLAWQTFRAPGQIVDSSRCPNFGWNNYLENWTLTDCRYTTNIETSLENLTGSDLWRP